MGVVVVVLSVGVLLSLGVYFILLFPPPAGIIFILLTIIGTFLLFRLGGASGWGVSFRVYNFMPVGEFSC